jgi:hypothetical protein
MRCEIVLTVLSKYGTFLLSHSLAVLADGISSFNFFLNWLGEKVNSPDTGRSELSWDGRIGMLIFTFRI